jgi:2-polyprenyl-6-methoxyphenol hydroxylase-like FAD-dependent oxidoreductase
MHVWTTTCLVAGGGPAGMMLGYLLARSGVSTLVVAFMPQPPKPRAAQWKSMQI